MGGIIKQVGYHHKLKKYYYYASDISASVKTVPYFSGDYHIVSDIPIPVQVNKDTLEGYGVLENYKGEAPEIFGKNKFLPIKQLNLESIEIENPISLTDKGITVDDRLNNFFKTDIFSIDSDLVEYMPYASHEFVFTTTKTGKTFIADRTSVMRLDKATTAPLLGFGTADTTTRSILESLNGGAVSFDEMMEVKGQDLYGGLLTLMEVGFSSQASGCYYGVIKCNSPFRFMGNPRNEIGGGKIMVNKKEKFDYSSYKLSEFEEENEESLYSNFNSFIFKLGNNSLAMGSRIGGIIFSKDIKPRSGKPDKKKLGETQFKLLQVARLRIDNGKELTKTFSDKKIIDWVDKEYETEYSSKLTQLADKCSGSVLIRNFIKGHKNSERHARGMAVRLSIVNPDFTLEEAYNYILGVNIDSLSNILSCDKEFSAKYKRGYMCSMATGYFAYFIYLCNKYCIKNKTLKLPLKDFEPSYKSNDYFGDSQTDFFAKILKKIYNEYSDYISFDGEYIYIKDEDILGIWRSNKYTDSKWYIDAMKNKKTDD